jgi:hypothetical protein
VQVFARIFFHMNARQAHAALFALQHKLDVATLADRSIKLADLIALGQVWVKVVLARKLTAHRNLAATRQAHAQRKLDGATIEHRQRARQSQRVRIDVTVGCSAVCGSGSGEGLAAGV